MLLLDVLLDREPHAESSSAVWRVIEEGRVEGLLPAHAVTTIYCLLRSGVPSQKTARQAMASLLRVFKVAPVDNASDPIYLELVDFLAGGSTPEEVANFRPSEDAQRRVSELIGRERQSCLSVEESAELAHFLELEHILRMAKAKARLIVASRQ